MAIVEQLLRSESVTEQSFGLKALKAALEAWQFASNYDFDFGAHLRDYGYWPETDAKVDEWYAAFLDLAKKIGSAEQPVASLVRKAVAQEFRGLWMRTGLFSEIEQLCQAFSRTTFWEEGWTEVRETLDPSLSRINTGDF